MPAERVRHPPQPGLLRRVHVDLLRDLLRLDLLVRARDEHVALRLARLLSPVLLGPLVHGVLVDEVVLLAQRLDEDTRGKQMCFIYVASPFPKVLRCTALADLQQYPNYCSSNYQL